MKECKVSKRETQITPEPRFKKKARKERNPGRRGK